MRRTARKSLAIAAAAVALALPAAAPQGEYQPEYRLSTVVGTAFPWGKGGEIWADLVRERTNGRINIKMYPGASLVAGDQTREFTAIRQGVIDLAIGSTINWSPQIKELNLFSLPFLMPDYAGDRRADPGRGRQGHVHACSRRTASCRSPGARTAFAKSPIPSIRSASRTT